MIIVKTINGEVTLTPTIFPDGTSQVWKLPKEIIEGREFLITWYFESEREIIDLFSLESLLSDPDRYVTLDIPYLPYARQDKEISNSSTFNFAIFFKFINRLHFQKVTSLDVHNPSLACSLIHNFHNKSAHPFHEKVILDFNPSYIVFPDKGAMNRYGKELSYISTIFCDKIRDQGTGNILGNTVHLPSADTSLNVGSRLLIVDDICDGGATFIGVAKSLREIQPDLTIKLCVTHGIFSKGRDHLFNNGIDGIYTTTSLIKNKDGMKI